jgi:pimeloyl-ACP methyl ester carboxylesterase
VVGLLAENYRIIRYDSRGAGESAVPTEVAAYRVETLADDFGAVIDAVCPGEKVHVVAHDWGAATLWEYVTRPQAVDRVASYTSISGPDPGHLSRFIRDGLARPYRPRRFARALAQTAHFSYMIGFSIPVLAPAAMRSFLARWINRRLITRGIPAQQRHQCQPQHHRHENRTHPVHQFLHRRPRRLRRRHQLRHTRECRITPHRASFNHQAPIQRHGASGNTRSFFLFHSAAFAGQRAFIHAGAALPHQPIHGNTLTRAHHHQIAHRQQRGGHFAFRAIFQTPRLTWA